MSDHTDLKPQYVAQVAGDLERNAKERERIGAEIAALQDQLRALERDHALLLSVQAALAGESSQDVTSAEVSSTPSDAPAATKPAALPNARKPKEANDAAGSGKNKSASPKGRARRTRPAGAPRLRELVSDHLSQSSEPRSAAEITTALTHAHPDREIGATVVRNTLESLVAKGEAQRTKQQRSVFYSTTAPRPAAGAAEPSQAATA